jgi:heat shock protein HslJ
MKKTVMIVWGWLFLSSCSIFKTSNRSRTFTTLQHKSEQIQRTVALSTDTFIVTSVQYLPIEGRSETGTHADLEGIWVLDSLNGKLVPDKLAINLDPIASKILERSEWRHDSTTHTTLVNGVTKTVTTVLVDRMAPQGNKITPPQGSNYHIPAKPSISFYGSNETFSGFTGCNKFSGRYTTAGKDTIRIERVAASTKMVCIGDYDEETFLNSLKQVNRFKTIDKRLELLAGKEVILVFTKREQ